MMSCIFCDFRSCFRTPGLISAFLVDLIGVVVVHLKKNLTSGQSGSCLEWSVFTKKAMCFSYCGAICVFMASRSVYVLTLEVGWQRFLVFLWLMTKREAVRQTDGERERFKLRPQRIRQPDRVDLE